MAKSIESSSRSGQEKSLLRKLAPLGLLTVSLLVSLGAYSEKQKAFIKERDEGCQFPGEHNCGGKLIIHQIKPPAYSKKEGLDPDYPENGLTICSNAQRLIYSDFTLLISNYFHLNLLEDCYTISSCQCSGLFI